MKVYNLIYISLSALCSLPPHLKSINSEYPFAGDSLKLIEKVYLHVDRDSYYPGDDIWFKAYLIDASSRLLSSQGTNLHVELISPSLAVIDSRVVKMNRGLGNGDFHISEKLNSGRYRLRAYTNYMRNFGDVLFFNKDILIINSLDAGKTFSEKPKETGNKPEISFFPEGGSLIDDVPSIVAFKAIDPHGYAYDVNGEIQSSKGEIVTEFKSTHKGMGTFSLKPVPGLKYFAVVKTKSGDLYRYEIPKRFSSGVVLSVSKNPDGSLLTTFKTNEVTLPLILERDLLLTVSQRNTVLESYSLRMKSQKSYMNLSTIVFPDGILTLTLSGMDSIPICERLVYIHNEADRVRINLTTSRNEYNKRDSVSVRISLADDSGNGKEAFLSLSATEKLFTDNSSQLASSISSWFLLQSDVRGPVEEPNYYFDPANPDRLKNLDLLLLTQGWRDFKWKYASMRYPPEYGFTFSGRVRKKFVDTPLKNSSLTIGIFKGGNPHLENVPLDSAGRFYSQRIDFTGDAKLVVSCTGDNDKLKGWILLDSVRYIAAAVKDKIKQTTLVQNDDQFTNDNLLPKTDQIISKNLHTFVQYAEIKQSIQKQYKLSDTIRPGEVTIIAKRKDWTETAQDRSRHYLMGAPDIEKVITPEDNMYVTAWGLIKFRYVIPIQNIPSNSFSHWMRHPLYMIDGVRVSVDEVKSLPISFVERIDVVNTNLASLAALRTIVEIEAIDSTGMPYTYLGYPDGAISIILKDPNDPAFSKFQFHSVNRKISGYYEPRIFYSPKHHTSLESDYKPDLRTTLFWEPNIKIENNEYCTLNYYNTDNSSTIKIVVEGITSNGIPVTGKVEYQVK
jgi:hypothetical protein